MSPACGSVRPGIGRTMLSFLFLSGLCSCVHRYHLIAEPKTWVEAQSYCRDKYTDLATVENREDMERLVAAAGDGFEGHVWIGLYDKPDNWVWTYTGDQFSGAGELDYRRWKEGQPNNTAGRKTFCASIQNGFWFDNSCDTPYGFVCYDENLPDPVKAPTAEEAYVYIRDKKSWRDARAYCKNKHTALASVRNEAQNMMIQEVVPAQEMVLIGLYRVTWMYWSDYSFSSFTNWADGHPMSLNKSCAASVFNATHRGEWVENHCDEKLHFMCQHNKKQLFQIKLTALKSTIDPNDPAVTEAILNLFEERMKEKGITSNVKISWVKKPDKTIFHKEEEKTDL